MPVAHNFTSVYSHNWEINFLQCTPNGLLKYTELCNILQLTAGYHAETGSLSFTDMQVHNQAWVLSRMRVEINALPRWGDTVTVKTWIMDLHGSRSLRALEMYNGDKKIAGSTTLWVVFNTKFRKAEPLILPHSHYEKFADNLPTQQTVSKINIPPDSEHTGTKKVVLSDLDIVSHVNNVKYLEWCLDNIEPEIILKQNIKSFDMNFLRELYLGDTVTIDKGCNTDHITMAVSKNEKPSFALDIILK